MHLRCQLFIQKSINDTDGVVENNMYAILWSRYGCGQLSPISLSLNPSFLLIEWIRFTTDSLCNFLDLMFVKYLHEVLQVFIKRSLK